MLASDFFHLGGGELLERRARRRADLTEEAFESRWSDDPHQLDGLTSVLHAMPYASGHEDRRTGFDRYPTVSEHSYGRSFLNDQDLVGALVAVHRDARAGIQLLDAGRQLARTSLGIHFDDNAPVRTLQNLSFTGSEDVAVSRGRGLPAWKCAPGK